MQGNAFYRRFGKRAIDLAIAVAGLMLLAPLIATVAVAVFLVEGTPIFFRQTRLGRDCRPFVIYKFRTMRTDASMGSSITLAGDARTTRLGRFLRRLKLDELPQLWNVASGDMSLVGPRPDVPGYLDRLTGEAQALWSLQPGITGPGTLRFRREEELLASSVNPGQLNDEVIYPEKVRLNLIYLRRCSFTNDLRCLLATVVPPLSPWLGLQRSLDLELDLAETRIPRPADRSCAW